MRIVAWQSALCGVALVASVSASYAQVQLTEEQRTAAYKSVIREKTPEPHRPSGFNIILGQPLPSSVPTNEFPASVDDKAIRQYQYVAVDNQVVLIDPKTRKMVEVLK
jgi:hypothetical protein